jgi:hypothetical protein
VSVELVSRIIHSQQTGKQSVVLLLDNTFIALSKCNIFERSSQQILFKKNKYFYLRMIDMAAAGRDHSIRRAERLHSRHVRL